MKKRAIALLVSLVLAGSLGLTACGGSSQTAAVSSGVQESEADAEKEAESQGETDTSAAPETESSGEAETAAAPAADASELPDYMVYAPEGAPELAGNAYVGTLDVKYAKQFAVYYYENGYKIIEVSTEGDYLLVPEGADVPAGAEGSMRILQMPLDNIYLQATFAMALFTALDAQDHIKLVGTDVDGWTFDEPKDALQSGEMLFAGNYSAPDYELLINQGCDLAIESTMILHVPEVQEMLENIDIPVFIDRCSYEETSFGRSEWIKCYGAMVGKEAEAAEYYAGQEAVMEELNDFEDTGLTVAFFAVNTSGMMVVRSGKDYVIDMIREAGGSYSFDNVKAVAESNSSVIELSVEEFYANAIDADYFVYNASMFAPLTSMDDLLDKNKIFADMKAVKEGHVYQVGSDMFQATDRISVLIRDFHIMLTGGDESQFTFLTKIE